MKQQPTQNRINFEIIFIQLSNSSGIYNYTYIYQGNQLVAKINPDNSKYYYHPDHLGSTSLITNSSGGIVEETFYLPYGEVFIGGDKELKLFTGKIKDDTGFYYYGARYYDPYTTRFIQADLNLPDVYDPQQLNRYSYARNNPYTYIDKEGKAAIWIHYADTFQAYWTAGYSMSEAHEIAKGAISPDLYRAAQGKGVEAGAAKDIASGLGINLNKVEEQAGEFGPEKYFHEYKFEGSEERNLEKDYEKAMGEGDLFTAGMIEHALGHDVGSGGIPGYHDPSNPKGYYPGGTILHRPLIDVLNVGVDRGALNREQSKRAQESAKSQGKEAGVIERGVKSVISKVIDFFVPGGRK